MTDPNRGGTLTPLGRPGRLTLCKVSLNEGMEGGGGGEERGKVDVWSLAWEGRWYSGKGGIPGLV